MMVLECLVRGINDLKLTTVYNKRTHQAQPTGFNKNNNFDNGRISRTRVLGAQKNCLIETLLLNA